MTDINTSLTVVDNAEADSFVSQEAPQDDSFELLAGDLMDSYTATVKLLHDLSDVEDVSVEDLQEGLAHVAQIMGRFGMAFAVRGINLSGALEQPAAA